MEISKEKYFNHSNDFLKFCKENGFNISEAEISLKLIKEIIYNNRIKKKNLLSIINAFYLGIPYFVQAFN